MKPTMLDAEGAHLIATLILDAIKGLERRPHRRPGDGRGADRVGGGGGEPCGRGKPINAFFVRKQAKEHGTKSLIEGLPMRREP